MVQGIVGSEDARVSLPAALGIGRCQFIIVFCADYGCNKCSNRSKKSVFDEKASLFRLPCAHHIGGSKDFLMVTQTVATQAAQR